MNEDQTLRKIFGGAKWKDKYDIDWCNHCNVAIIECPECHNSSCNGGGCSVCGEDKDHNLFYNTKNSVLDYLSEEESKVYMKCLQLQKFICNQRRLFTKSVSS